MNNLPNSLIVDLHAKVSPAKLAAILGVNVSLVYQEAQKGRLPTEVTESTYLECLHMYLSHFKKKQDVLVERERLASELKEKKLAEDRRLKEEKLRLKEEEDKRTRLSKEDKYGEDGMPPLLAAKYKQDIRLNIAKEAQLWLKIAIERQEYVSVKELLDICEPFIATIKIALNSIAEDIPESKKRINQGLEALYNLGLTMIDKTNLDKDSFVKAMLEKEIDLDSLEIEFVENKVDF